MKKNGILTRSAFASMVGMKSNALSVYIRRNKVKMEGEMIDPYDPINAAFLESRLKKMRRTMAGTESPSSDEPEIGDAELTGAIGEGVAMTELTKRQKIATIQKTLKETRLLTLREEKIRGEVIPVDLVKNLFRSHTQSILFAQKDGIEELLINISVEARLTGEQLASLRGKMVSTLNSAVDKAILITQRQLKTIINTYSKKREVGEHD